VSSESSIGVSPGTSAIHTWLLNHGTVKSCPEWQFKLDFRIISSTTSLECLSCGQVKIVSTLSPGHTIEMLEEILELPGVYLQLQFDKDGLETKSEQHESS